MINKGLGLFSKLPLNNWTFQHVEIPEHNIMTEKENPELQKVLCTWKLAKKWKKLNIYSDVSGQEALIIFPVPSPVKTPRQMDLFFFFLYKP